MTKLELEKIINDINKNSSIVGTPKLPAGGFSSKKRKKWHCHDWHHPENDILKEVFGNPIQKVPVVAVIDSANKNSNTKKYDGKDVPDPIPEVVVAVGVNYGQIGSSSGIKLPYDNTGMRNRLGNVYTDLLPWTTTLLSDVKNRNQVVLIATNFFPWLSQIGWGDIKNTIEEMLLIYSIGFSDPFSPLTALVKSLNKQQVVPHLVFHGANNAVPLMGRIVLENGLSKCKFRSVVFCDNLAQGVGISNAVLWECDPRYMMVKNIKATQRTIIDD